MKSRTPIGPRVGLTLVELVVVLVILVLIAGTALTATGSLVDESRYEATQTELRNIETALLGHYDSSSQDRDRSTSFVADVGRLPFVASADPELNLAELWERPPVVSEFTIQRPVGDPDVRLPGGWRGPYLHLGFGSAKLVDGWNRSYDALAADDSPAMLGAEISKLRTLGANLLAGGTGYDEDAVLVLRPAPPALGARHLGTVPFRVTHAPALGERIVVRIYGPRDGVVVTLDQKLFDADGADAVGTFPDVPIGPRAVRAYRVLADPAGFDALIDATAVPHTPIEAITVVQGGIPEVQLELP